MAGHDFSHKRSIQYDASARVAAIRRWVLEIRHFHEIRQDLEDLTDMGILEEEIGPVTCARCNSVIAPKESFCRRCGAELGEEDAVPEPDPDDEMWQDELAPVHGSDVEMATDMELPVELGLIEKLQESLIELGWMHGEAEYAAVLLASNFEGEEAVDNESFEAAFCMEEIAENDGSVIQRLLEPSVQSRMLNIVKKRPRNRSEQVTEAKADIYIFRGDEGGWRVEVEDLLADKVAVKPSARLQLGDVSVSLEKYLEVLQSRPKRLRAIGRQLLRHFQEDFFEQGIEQANSALIQRAMEQKKVARAADMPESTFSRWCDPTKGGVWVSTPHGPYHLGAFFRRAASTDKGGKSSRAGVTALVLVAIRELEDEIPNLGEKLSKNDNDRIRLWLEGHDIKMAERTLRGYWKDAHAVVGVARAIAELRKQGNGMAGLTADRLREESGLKFDDVQFNLYLQLAQFYRDQKWDEDSFLGAMP